jgi:hypothetical protein
MQIELNMRHIPQAGESARSRHEVALRTLRAAHGFTKRYASDLLCLIDFAEEGDDRDHAGSDLSPICVEGVIAEARYGTRYPVREDMAMDDDSLILKLDTAIIDYCRFITESLTAMIGHFSPYRADMHLSDDLSLDDFRRARRLHIDTQLDTDARRVVYRINPVNFFDRAFCQRAFNTTPEAIVEAVTNQVERVEMLNDGVFLIVTSQLLSRPEIEAIDPRIRPLVDRRQHT